MIFGLAGGRVLRFGLQGVQRGIEFAAPFINQLQLLIQRSRFLPRGLNLRGGGVAAFIKDRPAPGQFLDAAVRLRGAFVHFGNRQAHVADLILLRTQGFIQIGELGADLVRLAFLNGAAFFHQRHVALIVMPMVAVPIPQQGFQLIGDVIIFLGALRLAFQTADAGLQLGEDIRDADEILLRLGETVQGLLAAGAEESDARGFLKEAAAVFRTGGERGVDQTLADDGIRAFGEAGLRQQFVDVLQADTLAVQQVFILPIAVGAAGDRDFLIVDREPMFGIVKSNGDGGHPRAGFLLRAGEDHVRRTVAAQDGIRLLPQNPADGVRDVRLPRAVRADNCGDRHGKLK